MAASESNSHVRVTSVNRTYVRNLFSQNCAVLIFFLRRQRSRRLVNASKIIRIVRAKLYNSELSDEFMKYLLFVTIYIAILFAQRNGTAAATTAVFFWKMCMHGWRVSDELTQKEMG